MRLSQEVLREGTDLESLPRALPQRPRVRAYIKKYPEDFVVEEVLGYEPSGMGQHIYLRVEKRDCSGGDMLARLAAHLCIPAMDIGYAGTKDRRAVTSQWVSVPEECQARLEIPMSADNIKILAQTRHWRKLRLGRLKGNRFRILLRGADQTKAGLLSETMQMLMRYGFPNLFGKQRFGQGAHSLEVGLTLLEVGLSHSKTKRLSRFEKRMAISSVQSVLFNYYVRIRHQLGLLRKVIKGDIMRRRDTRGLFLAENPEAEQKRFEAGETVITGPIFGHKMMQAEDTALELERKVLELAGLSEDHFETTKTLARGTRRDLLANPTEGSVLAVDGGICLQFFLPKGVYASVMLREFVEEIGA